MAKKPANPLIERLEYIRVNDHDTYLTLVSDTVMTSDEKRQAIYTTCAAIKARLEGTVQAKRTSAADKESERIQAREARALAKQAKAFDAMLRKAAKVVIKVDHDAVMVDLMCQLDNTYLIEREARTSDGYPLYRLMCVVRGDAAGFGRIDYPLGKARLSAPQFVKALEQFVQSKGKHLP